MCRLPGLGFPSVMRPVADNGIPGTKEFVPPVPQILLNVPVLLEVCLARNRCTARMASGRNYLGQRRGPPLSLAEWAPQRRPRSSP
jgi:hypothetical protein